MKINYWFTIEPYVYINIVNKQALLYNTLEGKYIKTCNLKIIQILKEILCEKNCGVVLLPQHIYDDIEIKTFINELQSKFMGDIIEVSLSEGKPVQILPYLNYKDLHKNKHQFSSLENLLQTLCEITIYLDNTVNIKTLIEYLRSFSLNLTYNIIGDWKDIPHGSLLIDYLGQMSYSNYIQCSYTHIPLLESSLKKNFSYQVYVSLPVDHSLMNNTCIFLDQQKIPFQYIFQVTSLEDCNEAVTLIEKYDIDKYQLRPLYTKDNISFLAKNTFLTEEDILSTKISMKDIFRKHIINKDNFGKLFILSNGDIYANILHKKLGNIKTDSIYQIVKKEIGIGESWLRIRNQKPCCDCLYQYICPSPSDLDLMIGQLNLCTVNNK